MHKITKTQRSTGKQLDYMAENLRERHKTPVSIQRLTFVDSKTKTAFWISVKGIGYSFKDTWEEAQAYYRKLMKQPKNKPSE